MDIAEYIAAESAKAFRWGETDCCTTADRWVRGIHGFSPLAAFGRVHKTEEEARQWLSEPGSIAVAVNRVMRSCGLKKTNEPQAGDVGLILHAGKVCVAIHAGTLWFSRDETGLIGESLSCHVIKAWKI